jgi:hypothetical protein
MSDSYDDYEAKIQLAEQAWEKRVVKTEHDRAVELGQAYQRGWNAALAQREWVPEALRLADALDAEFVQGRISNSTGRESAVELRRLHEALETEQEPVAWMFVNEDGECEQIEYGPVFDDPGVTPLYTAPPKHEWVGLTDEEIAQGLKESWVTEQAWQSAVWWAEAKLKEKNGGEYRNGATTERTRLKEKNDYDTGR